MSPVLPVMTSQPSIGAGSTITLLLSLLSHPYHFFDFIFLIPILDRNINDVATLNWTHSLK
jgi:hypothetical protein